MSESGTLNPFAPPRAHVEDHATAQAIEMVTATRTSRLLAFLIDMSPGLVIGVVGALLALAMLPGIFSGTFDPKSGSGLVGFGLFMLVIGVAGIAWTVWTIVLLYRYGQTVGKKVMGIRVVRTDGSRVTFARFFFLRGLATALLCGIVGGIIGAIIHFRFAGNVMTLLDWLLIFRASHQCLHDNIADTKVVTAATSEQATLAGSQGAHLRTANF